MPPWPLWDNVVKESEAWQTAFREAMELSRSSHMSWEDEVQKEEERQRCDSSDKGSPELGSPPPALEEGNASNVSMVDDCNDRIEQGGYNFYNSHHMAPNFRWQGHMITQS